MLIKLTLSHKYYKLYILNLINYNKYYFLGGICMEFKDNLERKQKKQSVKPLNKLIG